MPPPPRPPSLNFQSGRPLQSVVRHRHAGILRSGYDRLGTGGGRFRQRQQFWPAGDDRRRSPGAEFSAFTNRQGLLLTHHTPPNGAYEANPLVSNYTVIYDLCFPAASDAKWRSLLQTNPSNPPNDDGDFFVTNTASGGIGINSNYRGRVIPGTWHRIAISVRAAPGEGQAQRYIDGQFVGAIGTTGSGLESRFGLGPEAILLTDDGTETAAGYLSSFYYVDRAMTGAEISVLGGPHAAGAATAGAPAPAYTDKMVRRPAAIGHRGGDYGSAPDNTLSALRQAFLKGAAGVEVDTRLTADGVAVCFHDATVDRTTNGSGPVEFLTLAELKLLDTGSKYSPEFAGEKVPTLAEALTEAKGKGIVYVDIKTGGQADAFAAAVAASGFPLADLWFWTPGDFFYAEEIRTAIPGAKILWGAPPPNWSADPTYFSTLRDAGVVGFSIGNGVGTPDLAFATRAKAEGFIVEVYTINDPDTMLRCAAAGVDYMETDFPATLVALQPASLAKASLPGPAHASSVTSPNALLRWVPAAGATSHIVHFGTTNPPPVVSTQTSDLYQTPLLASGATYYWRINEVTPGGTITGDVWSFTTPPPANGTKLEWEFTGNLSPALGTTPLIYADGAVTEGLVTYETSDDFNVPHINGAPAHYVRIPAFTDPANGFDLNLAGITPNGGSAAKVTRYTMVFDMLLPGGFGSYFAFFNSSPANTGDSDLFIDSARGIGLNSDGLGYSAAQTFPDNVWKRIAWVVDLPGGSVSIYVDGLLVKSRTGAALPDTHRWALGGAVPTVRMFNDNDDETSPALVSAFAFTDVPLTSTQILELGAPRAEGIFYTSPAALPPLAIQRIGNSVVLTWPAAVNRRLQRSTALSGWVDVPGTTGFGTYTETMIPGNRVFFRAAE